MNNSWAKVVLDSISPSGKRLTTVETRYWRAIHAEIMTHRDRARNAASSRAIPFIRRATGNIRDLPEGAIVDSDTRAGGEVDYIVPNCTYAYIKNDPCIPEFIGTEQKGMQSGQELCEPNRSNAIDRIETMRLFCLNECRKLYDLGVHKSIINRYLEPWSYITVVMTATEWKNFFRLRVHPKAEKHFNKVASQIKDAIDASVPKPCRPGEWHLPYVREEDWVDVNRQALNLSHIPITSGDMRLDVLKRVSAARCARVSYLTHDGQRSLNADLTLFNTLIHPKIEDERDDDVIHSSPLEHVAQAMMSEGFKSGPFSGWFQFRKEFANENVEG